MIAIVGHNQDGRLPRLEVGNCSADELLHPNRAELVGPGLDEGEGTLSAALALRRFGVDLSAGCKPLLLNGHGSRGDCELKNIRDGHCLAVGNGTAELVNFRRQNRDW